MPHGSAAAARLAALVFPLALAGVTASASAQGPLATLKLKGAPSQTATGALRCAVGEQAQLSIEGLDADLNRVGLEQYEPEVKSSDEGVVVARRSTYAHLMNVICDADGAAWIVVQTNGVRASIPVLVGSARNRATPKGPPPASVLAAMGMGDDASPTPVAPERPIEIRKDAAPAEPTTAPTRTTTPTQTTTPTTTVAPPVTATATTTTAPTVATAPPRVTTATTGTTVTTATTATSPTTATTTRTPIATAPRDDRVVTGVTPAAPTNVRATALTNGVVVLRWDAMPNALGYSVVRWLPDGKYVGASLAPEFGPTDTAAVTMQLDNGPVDVGVIARYGDGVYSPPSAKASVVVPRWYGRYRVSVLGFKVERETLDDPTETDGKRDEVYVRAAVAERDEQGNPLGSVVERQTFVHGDINAPDWGNAAGPNRRVKAGRASVYGGLMTGDAFPSAQPWQRATESNYLQTFPLLLWEGDLYQGKNSVQVAVGVWETDQRPGQTVEQFALSPERAAIDATAGGARRLEPSVAAKVVTAAAAGVVAAPAVLPLLVLSAPALLPTLVIAASAGYVVPRLPLLPKVALPADRIGPDLGTSAIQLKVEQFVAGLPATVTNQVDAYLASEAAHWQTFLNIKDRPIGIRKVANGHVAPPWTLFLNFEGIESTLLKGSGPSGLGAGIQALRFEDAVTDQGGNGIYTVYVQVQRLQ